MKGIAGLIFMETAACETTGRQTAVPERAFEKPVTAGATNANMFGVGDEKERRTVRVRGS